MNKPLVPQVKDRKNFGRLKVVTTLYLEECPQIDSFIPAKAVVTSYPDVPKAGVVVSGETRGGARSVTYNLQGYGRKPAPEWLLSLLRETRAYEGIVEL